MTLSLFEWSFFNNTVFVGIIITAGSLELQNKGRHIGRNTPCCPPFLYAKIAATAKAVAATVEEIFEAIAAGGWVVLVIIAVIIIIMVIAVAILGYWDQGFIGS